MASSWFSEFAGKAEDFLNKIDQNAAVALNTSTDENKRKTIGNFNGHSALSSEEIQHENVIPKADMSNVEHKAKIVPKTTSNQILKPENVSPCPQKQKNEKIKESRQSKQKITTPSKSKSSRKTDYVASDEDLIRYLNSDSKDGVEDKMVLHNEITNQNKEIEMLMKSNKAIREENESLQRQIKHLKENSNNYQGDSRKDEEFEKNRDELKKTKEENDKLNKSLQQTLEKLRQLESLQSVQNKLELVEMERLKLEQSNEELNKRIETMQRELDLSSSHISSLKSTTAILESEFSSYKDKAKSILSQKDSLISYLQGSSSNNPSVQDSDDSVLVSELYALRSEKELLSAEVSQLRASFDSSKEEHIRQEKDISRLRQVISQLQSQVTNERASMSNLQDENLQLRQNLSSIQYELELEVQEKRKLSEWKAKLSETQPSRGTSSPVTTYNPISKSELPEGEETLRTRIRALTESLLEKQSLINSLSSDKQLLEIKVERLQETMQSQTSNGNYSNSAGLTQTVISSQPLYLSESPWDSSLSTRIKRAFSTVDDLFCQAGLTLRRRPNLRLGFCIYIITLHFWVLFILFHSFPYNDKTEDSSGSKLS